MEEEEAAYATKSKNIIPIINELVKRFDGENIVILGRYEKQIRKLKKKFGKKVIVLKMSFDGKVLLENTDIFIGSGGTMTAEAALMGLPTISYNAVPNIVEKFLVKKDLVKRETNPERIIKILEKTFKSSKEYKIRALNFLNSMEDPIEKLIQII
jgi:predicted glycosyltransferase